MNTTIANSSTEDQLQQVKEKYQNHVNYFAVSFLKKLGLDTLPGRASGVIIEDQNGKKYIDCIGSYGILNIGHNHPRVIEMVTHCLNEQNLLHRPFLNRSLALLASRLAEITPGDLSCSFVCNSGSEAIDSAIKLARLCTNKPEIIAAEQSFHGYTYGALSVSGIETFKKQFQPVVPGIIHVPYNDVDAIVNSISEKTAAVLLEPVQHESGISIPSKKYFQQVREVCTEHDVLLVLDEIKTGFGRTGTWFASEHFGITPDVLVIGKALSGGLIPIAAIMAKKNLWRKFSLSFPMSASSYAGNALACIAALTTIEVIEREELVSNARKFGEFLLEQLQKLQFEYSAFIESVAGMGLLTAIKIVNPELALKIVKKVIQQGVLVMLAFGDSSVIMIEPPLCITKSQVDEVVSAFNNALRNINNSE